MALRLADGHRPPHPIEVDDRRQHAAEVAARAHRRRDGHQRPRIFHEQRIRNDGAHLRRLGVVLRSLAQRRFEQRIQGLVVLAGRHGLDLRALEVVVSDVRDAAVGHLVEHDLDLVDRDRPAAPHGRAQRLRHAQ